MMPHPKVASVRELRKRRKAFERLLASKGGPEAKYVTGSSSGQIQTPAVEPANLPLSHADYEIRTNDALGTILCSENKQINTVADSMAELELVKKSSSSDSSESMAELKLVKKSSSSSDCSESMAVPELAEKTSEEEESDSSSDSLHKASFGDAELIAYAKIQDNRDPYADSDSEHSAEEEHRLLFESLQEQWISSGKARELENLLELRKNFLCNLCHGKGHSSGVCPYLDGIPSHITTLPPGYSIMCKRCHKIVDQSCHHGDEARCAIMKQCVNCGKVGDHWVRECQEENPWWKLEMERQREKKAKNHKKNKA